MGNYRTILFILYSEGNWRSHKNKTNRKVNVPSKSQDGLKNNLSTVDSIGDLLSLVYKELDGRKSVFCIFVDLGKAFDTICHKKTDW